MYPLLLAQEARLRQQFLIQVESGYKVLLAELVAPATDLRALTRRYHQLQSQDYFRSPLGEQVRAALVAARQGGEP